ncbi:MAG: hypothetical protein K2W97_04770 [Chthoniobacterales bacterium]|nr:hypothetical protein [Chthoniobacterales bacterium]
MNTQDRQISDKLESSQAHAKKALETTAAAARELAGTARSVAQSAFRDSKDELSAAARDIGDVAYAKYSSLAEQTSNMTQQYREKACELEQEVTGYVRENPIQSLGIAFGVGLVLGVILNRK